MNEKRRHYSERLGRNFRDGDYLSVQEARAVLAANRGSSISIDLVSHHLKRVGARRMEINSRVHLYLYDDLKDIVVPTTRGRAASPSASPGALRQRAFKARQRQKKERGQADAGPGDACIILV